MNFAGVFGTPCVFFCSNNQYAISLPFARQTASGSVAVKAAAYGIAGVRVDGNDVLAVYTVTSRALERAREGLGPTLVEAVTYRMGAHSTSDDQARYRSAEEVEEWGRKDPIRRYGGWLKKKGLLTDKDEAEASSSAREEVQRAVAACESAPPVPPESLVEDVYAEMPWHLSEQLKWIREPVAR
jgi:TPP-dependent pyruvate/acetoin dehydrogenase alpha subunit